MIRVYPLEAATDISSNAERLSMSMSFFDERDCKSCETPFIFVARLASFLSIVMFQELFRSGFFFSHFTLETKLTGYSAKWLSAPPPPFFWWGQQTGWPTGRLATFKGAVSVDASGRSCEDHSCPGMLLPVHTSRKHCLSSNVLFVMCMDIAHGRRAKPSDVC